jgi:hypothetical protein
MALLDSHSRFCRIKFLRHSDEGLFYCNEGDAWDQCIVGPVSSYSSYGEQAFKPDQLYQRDALISLLHQAFNLGREDKRIEIVRVLGIPTR